MKPTHQPNPQPKPAPRAPKARVKTFPELLKEATPGPYFVSHDDGSVDAFMAHKGSGLALVDTGRTGDWPIAHFSTWPQAEYIARLSPATMAVVWEALVNARSYVVETSPEQGAIVIDDIDQAIAALNGGPQ